MIVNFSNSDISYFGEVICNMYSFLLHSFVLALSS